MKIVKNLFKYCTFIMFGIVILFCFVMFFITDVLKKDYINVFGYTSFIIRNDSMSGTIEANDIVFVKITNDVKVDDIVTFKSRDGKVITNRLVSINNQEYTIKADKNQEFNQNISQTQIIGKVINHIALKSIIIILLLVLLLYLLVSFIEYEFITKEYKKRNIETLPDDIFLSPKKREEIHSGMTVTIPIPDMEQVEKRHKEKLKQDEIEVLDIDILSYEDMKKKEKEEYEDETIDIVRSVLKCKNSELEKSRMNKKWVEKYQYIYRICQLLLIGDTNKIVEEIEIPPFIEIYDYDLEKVGLTKPIRNRIYSMPIPVIMNILVYCTLYNDKEMFDAIYKILKYKILVRDNSQVEYMKLDKRAIKKINELIVFMKTIPDTFDNKDVFQLEKIEKLIKIGEY